MFEWKLFCHTLSDVKPKADFNFLLQLLNFYALTARIVHSATASLIKKNYLWLEEYYDPHDCHLATPIFGLKCRVPPIVWSTPPYWCREVSSKCDCDNWHKRKQNSNYTYILCHLFLLLPYSSVFPFLSHGVRGERAKGLGGVRPKKRILVHFDVKISHGSNNLRKLWWWLLMNEKCSCQSLIFCWHIIWVHHSGRMMSIILEEWSKFGNFPCLHRPLGTPLKQRTFSVCTQWRIHSGSYGSDEPPSCLSVLQNIAISWPDTVLLSSRLHYCGIIYRSPAYEGLHA